MRGTMKPDYYTYQARQQRASYTVQEHTSPIDVAAFWMEWRAWSDTDALANGIRAFLRQRNAA